MRNEPRSPLGLFADGEARPEGKLLAPELHLRSDDDAPTPELRLSVIVPARNEAAVIEDCLRSLLVQNDAQIFALGREWEVIVLDDASSDETRVIAERVIAERVIAERVAAEHTAAGHAGVRVMSAPQLDATAFTGKSNACWAGAEMARGEWLLFTDADTLHEPGNLQRALHEAEKHAVKLLSYSPRQILSGIAQRLTMPLIFSELASVYPMAKVNDPAKKAAAANGQFLLVERAAYFAVGGHRAVGKSILEDVDLAWNVKRAVTRHGGQGIRFRNAPDALATRMYRGFGDMVEGWTKNSALLFPHALMLAAWRLLDIALLLLPALLFACPWFTALQRGLLLVVWLRTVVRFYRRVARAHFGFAETALSPLGLPLFIFLLVRSWMEHKVLHRVTWKGREYRVGT